MTKQERNKWTRDYLKNRYRKRKDGHVRLRWWTICKKVKGTQSKAKSYKGLPVCTFKEFWSWAFNEELDRLWYAWVASGFKRKLTPTVDRIVPDKGYVIGNMQWLTMSENSVKAIWERPQRQSKSGYIGVWVKGKKFAAYATNSGKTIYVGIYGTAEDAARARDRWARVYQGRHAKLNFPDS